MAASQIIIAETCNWCARQLSPVDLIGIASGQKMCQRCREWHLHALDVLAGSTVPTGCQQCGVSARILAESVELALPMYVIQKDGIYQLLCMTCGEKYVQKRKELFKNTSYGERL